MSFESRQDGSRGGRSLFRKMSSLVYMGSEKKTSVGKLYRMKVSVKIKRLLDCPQVGRNFYVKLKWGRSAQAAAAAALHLRSIWGQHEEQTRYVICKDRSVVWDEIFQRECQVYLEDGKLPDLDDHSERERLFKKQPLNCFLRMSLRQDSDRNFGKHSRYGYVEINLAEWAWDKCDGEKHNFAMLVQGTNNTSLLEVEVNCWWIGEAKDRPVVDGGSQSFLPAFEDESLSVRFAKLESKKDTFDKSDTGGRVGSKLIAKHPSLDLDDDYGNDDETLGPLGGASRRAKSIPKGRKAIADESEKWSSSHAAEAEIKLNDEHLQFLSAEASRAMIGFEMTEDRVAIAIQETKQHRDEAQALIDDIFQRCMPDHDTFENNEASEDEGISLEDSGQL